MYLPTSLKTDMSVIMLNICSIYVQYLLNICSIIVPYLLNICSIFVQYLFNDCSMYLLTSLKMDMSVIMFSFDAPSPAQPPIMSFHCFYHLMSVCTIFCQFSVNVARSPCLYYHLTPPALSPPRRSIQSDHALLALQGCCPLTPISPDLRMISPSLQLHIRGYRDNDTDAGAAQVERVQARQLGKQEVGGLASLSLDQPPPASPFLEKAPGTPTHIAGSQICWEKTNIKKSTKNVKNENRPEQQLKLASFEKSPGSQVQSRSEISAAAAFRKGVIVHPASLLQSAVF